MNDIVAFTSNQRVVRRCGHCGDPLNASSISTSGASWWWADGRWLTKNTAWIFAVTCLSLAARLLRIDRQPLWLDEVLTFQRIHMGLGGLVADSFANRHMPLYFLLLKGVSVLVGASDTWLRVPSALFGAMATSMVFLIACRIGGRGAGIVAGVLMALSPLQVQYGQEARSYTLVILLITVALWGLLRIAQHPSRAAMRVRSHGAEWQGWVAYALATAAALDVLSDALPWLIAANGSLFLIWRSLDVEARKGFCRNWIGSVLFIAVCTLPFYVGILAASDGHMLQKFDWIPTLSWQHVWVVISSVYLMRMLAVVKFDLLHTAIPLLGALVALAGCVGSFRVGRRLEGQVLLLGTLVLPLVILAISLFKSMLLPRYVLWSAAPFFVLAGVGAAPLRGRALAVASALLLVVGIVNLGPVYRMETKPRWDMAAATLAANVRPGDAVFTVDPNAPMMLATLRPKGGLPIQNTALVTSEFDQALARWRQGGRVWAINGRSALGQREDLPTFKNRMAALGAPAAEIPQGKEITILMFPAPEEAAAN